MVEFLFMPVKVQCRFVSFDNEGAIVNIQECFSDDYSSDLENFQREQPSQVVRITADLALEPDWKTNA